MDWLRLRFWNVLEQICILTLVFSGSVTLLELTGQTPNLLRKPLIFASNLEYVRFLPPNFTETWIPLAFLSFFFAIVAFAASRRRKLWHPSGLKILPGPNGGYLRKANAAHLKKEFSGIPWKKRRMAKKHFRKAERYFVQNQYRSAATEYRESASVFATMSAHLNEGVSLCYTSHFRKASDAFEEGLSMALVVENSGFVSAFHCSTCIPYRELGRLEDAHESFKEAYGLCMRSSDSLGRLCAVGNFSTLLLARGEVDEALQWWQDALEALAGIRCNAALAVALDGAGRVFMAKEDFRQALKHHRRALIIYRLHRSLPGTTGALVNIGRAHAGLDRRRRSLRINREALKLASQYASVVDQANIHACTALVHAKRDGREDALKLAEKALELYRRVDNPLGVARQLAEIAVIYASQEKTSEALKKLREARDTFEKVGVSFDEYSSLEDKIKPAQRCNQDDGPKGESAGAKGETMLLAEQA